MSTPTRIAVVVASLASLLGARTASTTPRADRTVPLAPLPDTPEIKAAQALEKQVKSDPSKAVPCGDAYIGIYNREPEAAFNDQLLLAAAECYQAGGSAGAAIQVLALMTKYYPTSVLAREAIGKLGRLYASVALYDKAADKLEEYARKVAATAPDAADALADAIAYRRGLGDDSKAIEDTKFLVATWDARRKADVAEVRFALTSIYEDRRDDEGLAKHLREYVATAGAAGGVDRLVMANAKLGMALWRMSCPTKALDGLCVTIERQRALPRIAPRRGAIAPLPTQCGPASRMRIAVVPRDARKVADAQRALRDAIAAYERTSGKTGGDEAGARYFYAQAKLAEADRSLEAYLAIPSPTGLGFDGKDPDKRKASLVAFDEWLAKKNTQGRAATAGYDAILAIKDAATAIAAAARLGQVSESLADNLVTLQIPIDIRTGPYASDKVDAFCDKLVEVAEPLEHRAADSFRVCATKAAELGVANEWSALCERELDQMLPTQSPLVRELRAEPRVTSPILEVEPRIADDPAMAPDIVVALAEFLRIEKLGWVRADCVRVAGMFAAAARKLPASAEARYMTGLAYHRCSMRAEAEKAYAEAAPLGGTAAAMATSNLAMLAHDAGKLAEARAGWEAALRLHGKLVGARLDLAWLGLREMRDLAPADPAWRKLDEDVRFQLSNAIAVNGGVKAHTLLALVWIESVGCAGARSIAEGRCGASIDGARVHRNRLELAKLSLAKAEALDPRYAPLRNAYGQYWLLRDAFGEAAQRFSAAADADAQLVDGRMNLGLASIATRKFDVAVEQFAKVLATAPASYDALIGLGIALRGLGDLDGAETQYKKAQALDGKRGEAYFDLAVLYRYFRPGKRADLKASRADYVTAREQLTKFLAATASDKDKAEAKLLAAECDTIVAQIDAFLAKKP